MAGKHDDDTTRDDKKEDELETAEALELGAMTSKERARRDQLRRARDIHNALHLVRPWQAIRLWSCGPSQ